MKSQLLDRLFLPLLIPLGIAAAIAIMLLAMSRILLAVDKEVAPAIALIVAVLILLLAAYIAVKPLSRGDVLRIVTVPFIVLIIGGIWGQAEYSSKKGEHGGPALISGGPVAMTMGDNFFEPKSLNVAVGADVAFQLTNNGRAIHNVRLAGPDNRYDTSDDVVSTQDAVRSGATATLQYRFQSAGEMNFRCDFHPADMVGKITIAAAPTGTTSMPTPVR